MKTRVLTSICAIAGLVSAGCLDNSTGIGCQQVGTLVTSTSGDTATTSTGLRYIDTEVGSGAAAQSCQPAAVSYVGQLTNGTVFDRTPGDTLFTVVPGTFRAISGFEQGVVGMKVGGTRRLIIPPTLGYGSVDRTDRNGNVVIPANSTIIFDVELVALGDAPTN
jgi:FKBP-type peptidyl-prolyl cis-trans isomerase FkpA